MVCQLYFNFKRKNRWKGRKTPAEILDETTGGRISPQVFGLPPITLDNLLSQTEKGGNLVGLSVTRFAKKTCQREVDVVLYVNCINWETGGCFPGC